MPSNQFFSSDDLALLQTFLEAWCTENSVDIHDKAAQDVAVGLIHWYQDSNLDTSGLKAHISKLELLPPAIQELVEALRHTR